MKTYRALLLLTVLAGCTTGQQATFAAMPGTGPMTDTRLAMARGVCKMHWDQQVDMQMAGGMIPNGLVEGAVACFNSQGINVAFVPKAPQ